VYYEPFLSLSLWSLFKNVLRNHRTRDSGVREGTWPIYIYIFIFIHKCIYIIARRVFFFPYFSFHRAALRRVIRPSCRDLTPFAITNAYKIRGSAVARIINNISTRTSRSESVYTLLHEPLVCCRRRRRRWSDIIIARASWPPPHPRVTYPLITPTRRPPDPPRFTPFVPL